MLDALSKSEVPLWVTILLTVVSPFLLEISKRLVRKTPPANDSPTAVIQGREGQTVTTIVSTQPHAGSAYNVGLMDRLTASVPLQGSGAQGTNASELLFQKGLESARAGHWEATRDILAVAVQVDPAHLRSVRGLIVAEAALGNDTVALERVNRSLDADPADPEMLELRAIILSDTGFFAEAVQVFDEAERIGGPNFAIFVNRAICYHLLGEEGMSELDFRRALAIKPDCTEARIGLANARTSQGDYTSAMPVYDKAIREDSDNAIAFAARAIARANLRDWKGAVEDLDEAVRLDPANDRVFRLRARAKLELGDGGGAEVDRRIADALAKSPKLRSNVFGETILFRLPPRVEE